MPVCDLIVDALSDFMNHGQLPMDSFIWISLILKNLHESHSNITLDPVFDRMHLIVRTNHDQTVLNDICAHLIPFIDSKTFLKA